MSEIVSGPSNTTKVPFPALWDKLLACKIETIRDIDKQNIKIKKIMKTSNMNDKQKLRQSKLKTSEIRGH